MDTRGTRRPLTLVLLAALLALVVLAAVLGRSLLPGASQPAAAQDGLIAFERYVESDPDPPQIAVVNADGTELIPLTTDGRAFDPAWSPDGTKIAYYLGNADNYNIGDIYVVESDGANPTRLTTDGRNLDPTWSPDGAKIAYVSHPAKKPGDFFDPPAQIYVIDADGSNPTPLTTDGENSNPAWSPDGTKLAFASTAGGTGSSAIFVMDADGSNPTLLHTANFSQSPTWSPDGSKIAFSTLDTAYTAIYVMDADGANPTRLTPSGARSHYMDPAWSPDGTRIAVASDQEDNALRIFVMDADGANLTRLSSEYGTGPAWAPDGAEPAS